MFQKLFESQETDWKLQAPTEFIKLPGDAYGFADFECSHPNGTTVSLECFHAWHAGPLIHRLDQLEGLGETPKLLLAVDRKLSKDPAVAARLEDSAYFQTWGFLFRDMPSPKALLKCLAPLESG